MDTSSFEALSRKRAEVILKAMGEVGKIIEGNDMSPSEVGLMIVNLGAMLIDNIAPKGAEVMDGVDALCDDMKNVLGRLRAGEKPDFEDNDPVS